MYSHRSTQTKINGWKNAELMDCIYNVCERTARAQTGHAGAAVRVMCQHGFLPTDYRARHHKLMGKSLTLESVSRSANFVALVAMVNFSRSSWIFESQDGVRNCSLSFRT